jgi:hypothetical protein
LAGSSSTAALLAGRQRCEGGATKNETETECFDRVYIELSAMEDAKEYFEKMEKF